jgi:nucleoside-diphosphate-sugar epimerase
MQCIVTGCAGFIGSNLCEQLLKAGHSVLGIDCFTDYYARSAKRRNLKESLAHANFTLLEEDLATIPLTAVLEDAHVVFHQAAQAGVRASWGTQFDTYTRNNILVTQRLLEACKGHRTLRRLVYASSSSIYGDASVLPLTESATPAPVSPYGVTKLAAEHLCSLYHVNFGVPTVSLRYFTVYGRRQRPDMAFHRFIHAALTNEPITVHEDGMQTRDFTHVSDIVQANLLAATEPRAVGRVYNIAGGARTTLAMTLDLIQHVTGRTLSMHYVPKQSGDVRDTYADTSRAREELGYSPVVDLQSGLLDEARWLETTLHTGVA